MLEFTNEAPYYRWHYESSISMSTWISISILFYTAGIAYCAYYIGFDRGFVIGKQRGWVNGYASAKATERVVSDEVFDYEKN
jgi:hypothetical protein